MLHKACLFSIYMEMLMKNLIPSEFYDLQISFVDIIDISHRGYIERDDL